MKRIQQTLWLPFLLACTSAETDNHPVQHLRRNLQMATKNFGQNHQGELDACTGDCNEDSDCRGDLICFQRDAGDDAPGCTLSERHRNSRVDFCVIPTTGSQAPSAAPIGATSVGDKQATLVSYNATNLGLCEGHCSQDTDCASGLKCHQRASGEDAPGCTLDSSMLSSYIDLCVSSLVSVQSSSSSAPVASPVHQPSSKDTFALKLYWEQGYHWQEEKIERKWCMTCRETCRAGGEFAVFECDDATTQWEFVYYGPSEVQIKVAHQNICVQENPVNDLELETCDISNEKQRFVAINGTFNDPRFEVSPKQRQDWCMTQNHHPKRNESVNIFPCFDARSSTTSFWMKY